MTRERMLQIADDMIRVWSRSTERKTRDIIADFLEQIVAEVRSGSPPAPAAEWDGDTD